MKRSEGRKKKAHMSTSLGHEEEISFTEFRRKVRAAEVLSASLERLMSQIHFNGKVSVVVQNGRVLKSGYEEGYFRNQSST